LAAAQLLGELPARTVVVGVVPAVLETGVGLSGIVGDALPEALETAGKLVDELLDESCETDPPHEKRAAQCAEQGDEPFTR
jgi:hypothetical protein